MSIINRGCIHVKVERGAGTARSEKGLCFTRGVIRRFLDVPHSVSSKDGGLKDMLVSCSLHFS